jgi:hypothetical protein
MTRIEISCGDRRRSDRYVRIHRALVRRREISHEFVARHSRRPPQRHNHNSVVTRERYLLFLDVARLGRKGEENNNGKTRCRHDARRILKDHNDFVIKLFFYSF